jgi:hypothetical protein
MRFIWDFIRPSSIRRSYQEESNVSNTSSYVFLKIYNLFDIKNVMYSLHIYLLYFYVMDDIIRNKVFFCFNETLVSFFFPNNGKEQYDTRPSPKTMLHICTTKHISCNGNSKTRHHTLFNAHSLSYVEPASNISSFLFFSHSARVFYTIFTTKNTNFPKHNLLLFWPCIIV